MAQGRSLDDLRARRAALVQSMEQHRVQISTSLREVSTRVPEVKVIRTWIGDHPALSVIGSFAAGMVLPALMPRGGAASTNFLLEALAPLLQSGLRSATELINQAEAPAPDRPEREPLP